MKINPYDYLIFIVGYLIGLMTTNWKTIIPILVALILIDLMERRIRPLDEYEEENL